MKNRKFDIKRAILCVCVAFMLCLSAFAITPRDMIENGEVSDGSVIYGDERDGIVSDVSSDIGDIRDELSEFGESMMPGIGGTEEIRTTDGVGTSKEPMTTDRAEDSTPEQTTDRTETADGMDARWGVVIAVIVVIAVVAVIFLFVRRK